MERKKLDELSQEELEELAIDVAQFSEDAYAYLAGTPDFEICPTSDEEGNFLEEEHYDSVKRQMAKLGLKVLYRIDKPNGETILLDLKGLKVMQLSEEIH